MEFFGKPGTRGSAFVHTNTRMNRNNDPFNAVELLIIVTRICLKPSQDLD